MKIIPITVKAANEFVKQYHRHNGPVVSHKFSIGLEKDGELVGVAIAGRPIARMLDNGRVLEIRRVCVKPGSPNACSKLLSRIKHIGQLMGYEKIITYTLQSESGISLRAVKARCVANVAPSTWHKGRKRRWQAIYAERKFRWELQDEGRAA